jgi:AcrR family transcriptional regulator
MISMSRAGKEAGSRRSEILDAAQMLVYTKGYAQMTIQDILDALHISKGAFYHYFASKQALLEALIDRLSGEVELVILPILEDPELPALEKLERFFVASGRWKTAQKAYLLSLMKVWYSDENAIVREKMFKMMIKRFAPLLANVIQQGIREGSMHTDYPEPIAEAAFYMLNSMGDTFIEPLMKEKLEPGDILHVENAFAAYTDSLERIIGAPQGSLHLIDKETLEEWFPPP